MVAVRGAGLGRPVVRLFSAAGVETGSFLWEKGGMAGWGWSAEQELVIVEATGKVRGDRRWCLLELGVWMGWGLFVGPGKSEAGWVVPGCPNAWIVHAA
jgi:hypothetical protein